MRLALRTLAVFFIFIGRQGETATAAKAGLAKAQELFQKNRWADARAEVRASWSAIPLNDQQRSRFLVGRSYVLEAEFYRAVRHLGIEIGLDYLSALAAAKENKKVVWIPLFTGLYQFEGENDQVAQRGLSQAAASRTLQAEWKEIARRRRDIALHRVGRLADARALTADSSYEGRYWRWVVEGLPKSTGLPSSPPRGVEPLLGACVLFRSGQDKLAEAMLNGLDPDRPNVEDKTDATKRLLFFDPIALGAQERIAWERAVLALRPVAKEAGGLESQLAAYYAGMSLYFLGARDEAKRLLETVDARLAGREIHARAQILVAAASGAKPAAFASLWESTKGDPESVLLWTELKRPELAIPTSARLGEMAQSFPPQTSGALVGTWGLVRLRRGADPGDVLQVLSRFRNHAEKNKLESNAPVLLLSLAASNYRKRDYAQASETVFELSKTFKGLRALQWNLQGVYAARHEAAGEARISR